MVERQMRALADMENSGAVPLMQQDRCAGAACAAWRLLLCGCKRWAAERAAALAAACWPHRLAPGPPAYWATPPTHPSYATPCSYEPLTRMYSLFKRVEGGLELLRQVGGLAVGGVRVRRARRRAGSALAPPALPMHARPCQSASLMRLPLLPACLPARLHRRWAGTCVRRARAWCWTRSASASPWSGCSGCCRRVGQPAAGAAAGRGVGAVERMRWPPGPWRAPGAHLLPATHLCTNHPSNTHHT